MLGSSWTDTPGLPNRHYLCLLPHSGVTFSPHLAQPCLLAAFLGMVEKRPQCHLVQAVAGCFLLPSHYTAKPSSPSTDFTFPAPAWLGAQMRLMWLSCVFLPVSQLSWKEGRGPVLWVLPACSRSPKTPLPLAPWCWSSFPDHGTFHPQVTCSQGAPTQMRMLSGCHAAFNAMQQKWSR